MGLLRRNKTLDWYHKNASKFLARTAAVDMTPLYETFLKYVIPGGRIMDLGCGSGSASLYFMQHGFEVLPVDGCPEMCGAATELTGCQARNILFQELDYENAFDAIWACASLLHVPQDEIAQIFSLVKMALKDGGTFYASFKYGNTERRKNGRLFSDYTEDSLKSILVKVGGFDIIDLWLTGDARPDRANEQWVNVICKKVGNSSHKQ